MSAIVAIEYETEAGTVRDYIAGSPVSRPERWTWANLQMAPFRDQSKIPGCTGETGTGSFQDRGNAHEVHSFQTRILYGDPNACMIGYLTAMQRHRMSGTVVFLIRQVGEPNTFTVFKAAGAVVAPTGIVPSGVMLTVSYIAQFGQAVQFGDETFDAYSEAGSYLADEADGVLGDEAGNALGDEAVD